MLTNLKNKTTEYIIFLIQIDFYLTVSVRLSSFQDWVKKQNVIKTFYYSYSLF